MPAAAAKARRTVTPVSLPRPASTSNGIFGDNCAVLKKTRITHELCDSGPVTASEEHHQTIVNHKRVSENTLTAALPLL